MMTAAVLLAALLASGLTFFTGFGLGTLLMPVFALFFPLPTAVAMTAVVHFANGLFKLVLTGRRAAWPVVLRFGLPAMAAAFLGAELLLWMAKGPVLHAYTLGGRIHEVTALKLVMAGLMAGFALLEASGILEGRSLDPRWLPAGGLLSGFFGGLSGHQGAFRAVFLLRAGLDQGAFVATGSAIAALVDLSRLGVYARRWSDLDLQGHGPLVAAAVLAAFAGAVGGNRLLPKVTRRGLQGAVSALLLLVAALLASGLL